MTDGCRKNKKRYRLQTLHFLWSEKIYKWRKINQILFGLRNLEWKEDENIFSGVTMLDSTMSWTKVRERLKDQSVEVNLQDHAEDANEGKCTWNWFSSWFFPWYQAAVKPDVSKKHLPDKRDDKASLDSMLGGLEQDLQDLGIATVPKGHCASCQKPIAGKVG